MLTRAGNQLQDESCSYAQGRYPQAHCSKAIADMDMLSTEKMTASGRLCRQGPAVYASCLDRSWPVIAGITLWTLLLPGNILDTHTSRNSAVDLPISKPLG